MKARLPALVFCFAIVTSGFARAESVAEMLGYGPDDVLLIVNADDAGMCYSESVATIRALKGDLVKSCTAMVTCPWFYDFTRMVPRELSDPDVGVHLVMTSEWSTYRWRPVAPYNEVRSLVDNEGFMWRDIVGWREHMDPRETEIEYRAQIERMIELGISPTHLDSHMGNYHYDTDAFNIIVKIAKEYNLPLRLFLETRRERCREEGILSTDFLHTDVPGVTNSNYYEPAEAFLEGLQPGVHELLIHVMVESDEARRITNSWQRRVHDLDTWTSERIKNKIDQLGIKIIRWKDIYDLQQTLGAPSRSNQGQPQMTMNEDVCRKFLAGTLERLDQLDSLGENDELLTSSVADDVAIQLGYKSGDDLISWAWTWSGDDWLQIKRDYLSDIRAAESRLRARRSLPANPSGPGDDY
ncbi:MAG: polysaccharide deacetylase family protein [Planctomycetes bacterium]|nr:polysaccharide deacetylase family protein [Planctomycetota bacterium]